MSGGVNDWRWRARQKRPRHGWHQRHLRGGQCHVVCWVTSDAHPLWGYVFVLADSRALFIVVCPGPATSALDCAHAPVVGAVAGWTRERGARVGLYVASE